MTASQTTRMDLGNGVIAEIESWDQLPVETRQQVRKMAIEMVAVLAPHSVTLVRIGPARNLKKEER